MYLIISFSELFDYDLWIHILINSPIIINFIDFLSQKDYKDPFLFYLQYLH